MPDPMVVCVMLTRDRPAMARRAVESFRAQTYQRKRLMIVASGSTEPEWINEGGIYTEWFPEMDGATIGALRNRANGYTNELCLDGPIIAHWDDDDWSHPRRLEEQVALLQSSGRDCVGYRELLFWDTRTPQPEAWLYRNDDARWLCGSSMLYRREAWERCPFDDAKHEDQRWWMKNAERCLGSYSAVNSEPRMICQMHVGGTEQIPRAVMESGGGGTWRRARDFDAICAERMKL